MLNLSIPQVQKLVNNWLVVTSFSIGVADTVADTETIMTIGGIIDTAKRCVRCALPYDLTTSSLDVFVGCACCVCIRH